MRAVGPGAAERGANRRAGRSRGGAGGGGPVRLYAVLMGCAFLVLAGQLVRLAAFGRHGVAGAQLSEPIVRTFARPDIVDRKGRLLATDIEAHSLFADPARVIDADEVAEKLSTVLTDLDERELRSQLADKSRRFLWIRRGLPPATAQQIHDLGLPGIAFRTEPRRSYPQGRLAGHVLGSVTIDNRGQAGIERHLDEALGLETGYSPDMERPPASLTIDIGAQYALEAELSRAMVSYGATGAAGLIMDVTNGEVLAAASAPDIDPARPAEALEPARIDRLQVASYELGSVLKLVSIAMALDAGIATPGSVIDVRVPLQAGSWTIRDPHPAGRPLTVREVFIQSSNVGAARLALLVGATRQRAFLTRIGLTEPMRTEVVALAVPRLPRRWAEAEVATIAYGYGIALAPLQFAAASAALVNGGIAVKPTFIKRLPGVVPALAEPTRVLAAETSAQIRDMMRRNVAQAGGTGHLAAVPGFDVGGKTGTAELSGQGGYRAKSVIASFLAAFPISAPRFLVLITLMEPKAAVDTRGQITAGVNAAPVAARVIARTGALLGVIPR